MPDLTELPVAKKKPTAASDPLTERVIFLAAPAWVERMDAAAKSLGLSLAAFIRLSCEEKHRRLHGKPVGD